MHHNDTKKQSLTILTDDSILIETQGKEVFRQTCKSDGLPQLNLDIDHVSTK
jgi:hypothetical protein